MKSILAFLTGLFIGLILMVYFAINCVSRNSSYFSSKYPGGTASLFEMAEDELGKSFGIKLR